MNTIKQLKADKIQLNNQIFKPYKVCDIPASFGFIYDEEKDKEGISEWFNYKGYTYIFDKMAKS